MALAEAAVEGQPGGVDDFRIGRHVGHGAAGREGQERQGQKGGGDDMSYSHGKPLSLGEKWFMPDGGGTRRPAYLDQSIFT